MFDCDNTRREQINKRRKLTKKHREQIRKHREQIKQQKEKKNAITHELAEAESKFWNAFQIDLILLTGFIESMNYDKMFRFFFPYKSFSTVDVQADFLGLTLYNTYSEVTLSEHTFDSRLFELQSIKNSILHSYESKTLVTVNFH